MHWKQQKKKLFVLFISLIALLSLQLILLIQKRASKQNGMEPLPPERVSILEQAGLKPDQIQRVRVRNLAEPEAAYSLRWEPESLQWKIEEPPFQLDGNAVTLMAQQILYLKVRVLKKDLNPEDPLSNRRYGFTTPRYQITLERENTSAPLVLLLGDTVPIQGAQYLRIQDRSELYLVAKSQSRAIQKSLNDLRIRHLPRLHLLDSRDKRLEAIEIKNGATYLRIEPRKPETPERDLLNDSSTFVLAYPYPIIRGVDEYELQKRFEQFPNPIPIKEYIVDKPTSEDLLQYGFQPQKRLEIFLEDSQQNKIRLELGNEADPSSLYAREASLDSIFTVSKEVLPLAQIKPFQMVDKSLALLNIRKVQSVTLTLREKSHRLVIKHIKNQTDQNSVKGGSVDNYSDLSEDETKELYQKFVRLSIAGEILVPYFAVGRTAQLQYQLINGSMYTIDFFSYSAAKYSAISFNTEKPVFLIENIQLQEIFEEMGRFSNQ